MDRAAVVAVGVLGDPTRAAVFEWVQAAREPATREAVADGVGISRKLAAFHLDRLVAAGLLAAGSSPARRVGRAPKVYSRSETSVQVSIPPRDHQLLADLLLTAVADAAGTDAAVVSALTRAATERGRSYGEELSRRRRLGRLGPERALTAVTDLLNEHGYLAAKDQQRVRLRNCPFQPLAAQNRSVVCAANHAFVGGLLKGLEARGLSAELVPDPGGCCVVVGPVS